MYLAPEGCCSGPQLISDWSSCHRWLPPLTYHLFIHQVQSRKRKKGATRPLPICLFLIKKETLSQKSPAECVFGQKWVTESFPRFPDQSQAEEDGLARADLNQSHFLRWGLGL